MLLKYTIAVYFQIYKHPSVQGVSECLENFISKEGKEFLTINENKHFVFYVQLNYVLTQVCPTSLLQAFIRGDLKTSMYSASIEKEGKNLHFHFCACQTLCNRRRPFATVRQSLSNVFVSALIQAE